MRLRALDESRGRELPLAAIHATRQRTVQACLSDSSYAQEYITGWEAPRTLQCGALACSVVSGLAAVAQADAVVHSGYGLQLNPAASRHTWESFIAPAFRAHRHIWAVAALGEPAAYYGQVETRGMLGLFNVTVGHDRRVHQVGGVLMASVGGGGPWTDFNTFATCACLCPTPVRHLSRSKI